jgi:hypothetical protein
MDREALRVFEDKFSPLIRKLRAELDAEEIGHHIDMTVSMDEDPWAHVIATVWGKSRVDCEIAATKVLDRLARGRIAFIRHPPTGETQHDFCKDKDEHRGYVRFSFKDEPGEWHYRKELTGLVYGLPKEGAA